MSGAEAGLLTTLPVLCFAGFGILAPGLAAAIGLHRAMLLGLLMMVTGQVIRALTGSAVVFLAATTLALAGLAAANILLPSLIKRHFPGPDRSAQRGVQHRVGHRRRRGQLRHACRSRRRAGSRKAGAGASGSGP